MTKDLSVTFSVDTIINSIDILNAFEKAGVDIDDISSIQRRASDKSWVVSFSKLETKEYAMELPFITIAGIDVFLGDAANRTVLVKIYEAPQELPDSIVIGRLSAYGKVLSFRRDLLTSGIENGIRTARMRLQRHIPSSVRILGEFIKIWYPSQPRTCRRCGGSDHFANGCKVPRCFNCEQPGHLAETCSMDPHCTICMKDGHSTNDCPYLFLSANVVPREPPPDNSQSYAQAVKEPENKGHSSRTPEQQQALDLLRAEKEKQEKAKLEEKKKDEQKKKDNERKRKENEEKQKEEEKKQEERERKEREEKERPKERREKDRDKEREKERERAHERERDRHERAYDQDYNRERNRDYHRRHDRD